MKYTFYCNCFKDHENKFTQFNQKNLMCGSSSFTEEYKKQLNNKGFLFDDTGDNISDLNPWLGDLTGLYWVWKNTNDEVVGTNQYRRSWNEQTINRLKFNSNTLYISSPVYLNGFTVYDHFTHCHGEIGMLILYEAASQKRIPLTTDQLNILKTTGYVSPCNMFFADRTIFNKICSTLFEIMFILYNDIKHSLSLVQSYEQKRMIAFVAERVLTVMYHNKEQFIGNAEIVGVEWSVVK